MNPWLSAVRPMAAALPVSGIIDVFNYGREKTGLIPFWVGEGDLPTPEFICDAAARGLREGHTFYTYQRGIPPLRQAVADYLNRFFDVGVDAERVVILGSGMQGIVNTMQVLAGPGDEVVVISPVWPNIFSAIRMQDAVPKSVQLQLKDGAWQLDLEELFDACGPRTKAIFINSPNNPTGWIMSEAEMIKVRDFARERGLWIVSDEVYTQFVYDNEQATSFLNITEPDDKLIVTNTFSKNWSMTGWRVGWVVIPKSEEIGQIYENIIQYSTSGVAGFMQHGCLTAVTEGDDYIKNMVERCRTGRDIVCDSLQQLPNVDFVKPRGAFYLFFRVDGEHDSLAFAKKMVDKANVGLAPGMAFGPGGEGFMRACFASSHDTLRAGVDRLVAALG